MTSRSRDVNKHSGWG